MERSSKVEIKDPVTKPAIGQKIKNLQSNLARVSNTLGRCDLCCNMLQFVFERTIENYNQSLIGDCLNFSPLQLFVNNLSDMRQYRLVSKAFYNFFNGSHKCLAKTIVYANEVKSLPKREDFNIILTINGIEDGELFTMPDGLDNVIKLSFGDIFYERPRSRRHTNASSFGDIIGGIIVGAITDALVAKIAPKIQKNPLILPKSMKKLTELSFGNIFPNSVIKFPSSIESLKMLAIKWIKDDVKLKLPDELPSLTSLKIGCVSRRVEVLFPNHLNKLTTFKIGFIDEDSLIQLPSALNNVKKLVFGDIYTQIIIQLPKILPNLISFIIGKIHKNAINDTEVIQLSLSMNNLKIFTIAGIQSKVCFKFPEVLDELEILDIGEIGNKAVIKLPKNLPALISLKIGDFGDNVNLNLSGLLNNLTYLSIGTVRYDAEFKLLSNCNALREIIIERIYNRAEVELPGLLNSLVKLMIGTVKSEAKVKLPTICNNLQELSIGSIGENVTLELPYKTPNLKTLKYKFSEDERKLIEKLPLLFLKIKLEGIQFPPSLSILFFVIFFTWSIWS